jgi:hypothetical protein
MLVGDTLFCFNRVRVNPNKLFSFFLKQMLSDDDDDKWTSSDESVSSFVGSSSSPFKPHLFESITKSSFKVSRQPLSGHQSNDWPCCEPSSYLPPLNKRGWLMKN